MKGYTRGPGIRCRRFNLDGRSRVIEMEERFWAYLDRIADEEGKTVREIVELVYERNACRRKTSAALRVFALEHATAEIDIARAEAERASRRRAA